MSPVQAEIDFNFLFNSVERITSREMLPLRCLLFSLAVVNLASGQHHANSLSSTNDRGRDDPTAMVASMGDHHNNLRETNANGAYPSSSSRADSDWQVNLDAGQAINVGWSLDEARNEILFTLKINTTRTKFRHGSDIFALGFSDYGQIELADFCLLWFDLAHSAQLRDALTDSMGRLSVLDRTESYCNLITGFPDSPGDDDDDDSDQLVFKFTRPLNTCQANHYVIDNGTTHLVWFKMDGPLMDMNRINLSELQQQQHKQSSKSSAPFESGLTRVQLAATRLRPHNKAAGGSNPAAHHSSSSSSSSSSSLLDVRMENYEIPARETTYWCKLFKLPHKFEQRKFHISKYEAVIEAGNEHIVHHMELFNCVYENTKQARDLRELYEERGGWSGECGAKDRPPATGICRRVILAWAMGAKPLEYPEQVGQPIGGLDYSPFVVLEVHYNNVEQSKGLQDNSGLRFHYTHKLRPFDAGIMEVGLEYTDKNSIPPRVIFPLAGYCVSECTRVAMGSALELAEHDYGSTRRARGHYNYNYNHHHRHQHRQSRPRRNDDLEDDREENEDLGEQSERYLNEERTNMGRLAGRKEHKEEGIYIFAAQMHTHLAGVASWTEQVREGRLLRELQRDNHYSPHFQEIRMLPEPVHLAPGDALIHYCLYDTRKRPNITLGGFATSDEMCVTYLHYYPRIELEVCKSSVDSRALDEYFAYLARHENQFAGLYNSSGSSSSGQSSAAMIEEQLKELMAKSVREKYQSIEWSERRSRELLEFYANAPLAVQCNRSNGDRFSGFWNGVTPTKVYWTNEHDEEGGAADGDGDGKTRSTVAAGDWSGAAPLGVDRDDPPGRRRLAGGYSPVWGSQIMRRYRAGPKQTSASTTQPSDQCSLANLHRQRNASG